MEGCFICCCPFKEGKGSREEKEGKLIWFVVEFVLELNAGEILEEIGGEGRRWRLCDRCGGKVKEGKEIYLKLVELVKKFRGTQEEIVKEARGNGGGGLGKGQKWRMAIDKRKDEFSGDFVVRPLPLEDWRFVPSPPERGGGFGGDSDRNEEEDSEVEVKEEVESDVEMENDGNEGEDDKQNIHSEDEQEIKSELEGDSDNDSDWEWVDEKDDDKFSGEDDKERHSSSESDWEPEPRPKRKKFTEETTAAALSQTGSKAVKAATEDDDLPPSRLPGPKLFRIIEGDSVRFEPYRTHTLVKRLPSPEPKRKRRKRRKPSEIPPPKFNPLRQSCDICGVELPTAEIEAHVLEHVGSEYLQKCPNDQCSYVFPQKYALHEHFLLRRTCFNKLGVKERDSTSILTQQSKYRCEECGTRTHQKLEFVYAHLQKNHELSEDPKLAPKDKHCPISGCSQVFRLRQSVELHLALHHKPNDKESWQICKECTKPSRIPSNEMESHLNTVHNAQSIIGCKDCPHLFSSREHLLDHITKYHAKSVTGYTCDICQFQVHGQTEWRKHYFEAHQIGDRFDCEICNSSFWTRSSLMRHKRKNHTEISCQICLGVTFHSVNKLRTHMDQVHGENSYKCKDCPAAFPNDYRLQKHVHEEHQGLTGPFPCPVEGCAKIFKTIKTLETHKLYIHRAERRKFVCHECGQEFNWGNTLRHHLDTVHLGLLPFICDTCGESFKDRANLRKHLATHKEEEKR